MAEPDSFESVSLSWSSSSSIHASPFCHMARFPPRLMATLPLRGSLSLSCAAPFLSVSFLLFLCPSFSLHFYFGSPCVCVLLHFFIFSLCAILPLFYCLLALKYFSSFAPLFSQTFIWLPVCLSDCLFPICFTLALIFSFTWSVI